MLRHLEDPKNCEAQTFVQKMQIQLSLFSRSTDKLLTNCFLGQRFVGGKLRALPFEGLVVQAGEDAEICWSEDGKR
jgi:hypothetical protein